MKQILARAAHRLAVTLNGVALRLVPSTPAKEYSKRLDRLGILWFIADTPLLIDPQAIGQMYDAVWRPEWEASRRTIDESSSIGRETANVFGVAGSATAIPGFLKLSGSSTQTQTKSSSSTRSSSLEEEANCSPERRLEQIMEFYVANHPGRVLWVEGSATDLSDLSGVRFDWADVDALLDKAGPRPLVIFDLGPEARLMPMACELNSGHVVEIYKEYLREVNPVGDSPKYPNSSEPRSMSGIESNSKSEYWAFARSIFDSQKVLQIIEAAARTMSETGDQQVVGSRFEWIDYRLLAGSEESVVSIHLHFMPRGKYSTGTFAYQLVRRADKFGIRLIGTLKKGKDVNVLAVYER